MRFHVFIISLLLVGIGFSSCRFTHPLTSLIRINKSKLRDENIPNKVKFSKEYYYVTFRRLAMIGRYTDYRYIEFDNGNCLEKTQTRKIAGYTPESPYFVSTKKTLRDQNGKKILVTKQMFILGKNNVIERNIYFENGKRKKVENCLKPDKK